MSGLRTVLLAGEGTHVVLHDLLAHQRIRVRILTRDEGMTALARQLGAEVVAGGLDDCASIRAAVKDCYGVLAAAADAAEGRNIVKVVAGAEVEHFVLAASTERAQLESWARTLGIAVAVIHPATLAIAASTFMEHEEHTCRTFSLPFFL